MNPESQPQQQKVGRPRKYSEEFRQQAVERMKTCDNFTVLAQELGVGRKYLYEWRDEVIGHVPGRKPGPKGKPGDKSATGPNRKLTSADSKDQRIAELERMVARQVLELDFFKGALQRVEERRRKRETISAAASTSKSGK